MSVAICITFINHIANHLFIIGNDEARNSCQRAMLGHMKEIQFIKKHMKEDLV